MTKPQEIMNRKIIRGLKVECFVCHSEFDLRIHHINFVKNKNIAKNLILVCLSCHRRIHHRKLKTKEKIEESLNELLIERVLELEREKQYN